MYYAYEVDDVLHRLVSDNSLISKLYRCYLYVLTAYCLLDRLTRRMGTEEALKIIGSPSIRSYTSLDEEQLHLLKLIVGCSPRR